MAKYILKRLLGVIPTIFIIVTISFFMIRLAPGDPFGMERGLPEQIRLNLRRYYNMDKPLTWQYFDYMGKVLKWDLGPSFRNKDSTVNKIIDDSFPVSLGLGSLALAFAAVSGVIVGIIAALKQNKWQDYVTVSVAVLGISVPLFVIGPVMQLIFALRLQWLPLAQWLSTHGIKALILPTITLAFPTFAFVSRLARASILEVLRSDYVRTARAKGLKESVVIAKHVLKGGLLPVVTYLGPAFANIVTGSVVVETIFAVPGLGRHFVQSAINRDYTLILGLVIVYSIILVLANFVIDLIYGFLDPRISYK